MKCERIILSSGDNVPSPDTLLGTSLKHRVGPPFTFRTALNLHGLDSARYARSFSQILIHIDMRASHSYCRFVAWTSVM